MSPAAKNNTKVILTITGSVIAVFVTVISSTAAITTKFNQNDLDHTVIKQELRNESIRNADAQSNLSESYYKTIKTMDEMRIVLDAVKSNQIQVMTNQERIKTDIQKISDKIGTP